MAPSSGVGGCQQHRPERDALELAPAVLRLAWLRLPHSYLSSAQPGGGSRCLAQLPKSGRGAAALLSCSEHDWRWRSAPFPRTLLTRLWPVWPDPSPPSRQTREVISRWGHPMGHGHGPARGPACVRGPSPAGQGGGGGAAGEVVLDKYLLHCAVCRGSAGFLPPAGDGGWSQKGALKPRWAPPPSKRPSSVLCSSQLFILGFGLRCPALTLGLWGCPGWAALAVATRGVLGRGSPGLQGSRDAEHPGVSAHPGFGNLLASTAHWWGWAWTWSRAEPRAGPHMPWGELLGGICPPNLTAHLLATQGAQDLASPLAMCRPAACEGTGPLRVEVSEATSLSRQREK